MIYKNTDRIKSISFKYPDLMSEDAEKKIRKSLEEEKDIEDRLWSLRQEVFRLEKNLKDIKDHNRCIKEFVDIDFEIEELKEIKNVCNLKLENPSDYRNK